MKVVKEARRHSAIGVTDRKRSELLEVALRWHAARDEYVRKFWAPEFLQVAVREPRRIREQQRAAGWAAIDLTVHYHQTALLSAASAIRLNWLATAGRVRRLIARNRSLDDAQRHWAYYVLRDVSLVQRCMNRQPVQIDRPWATGVDQSAMSQRLRRWLIRHRLPLPRVKRRNWFEVDSQLYKTFERPPGGFFRGTWVALTGINPGRRVCVPIAGVGDRHLAPRVGRISRPNLRVEIGERIGFHTRELIQIEPRSGRPAGIDKGFATLVTVASSADDVRLFGVGAGQEMAAIFTATEERRRERRRLAAYERSLRQSDAAKARRLRRNNLRSRREDRRTQRDRAQVRGIVDHGLNDMFSGSRDLARLYCESLTFVRSAKRPRAFNRRIARWTKGYLHLRLKYKAELNGVELHVVNAAYTSQTCPRCWFTSTKNRQRDRFECADCGYIGSADAVAAINVLRRGSDPAIARSTTPVVAKQILLGRWQAARTERAWGSNEDLPALDVAREIQARRSREQLPRGSSPLGGSNSPQGNALTRLETTGS